MSNVVPAPPGLRFAYGQTVYTITDASCGEGRRVILHYVTSDSPGIYTDYADAIVRDINRGYLRWVED